MIEHLRDMPESGTVPIEIIAPEAYSSWLANAAARHRAWLDATDFSPQDKAMALLPAEDGGLESVLVLVSQNTRRDPWAFAHLASKVPKNRSFICKSPLSEDEATKAAIAWSLSGYSFNRYKSKATTAHPSLVWPEGCNRRLAEITVTATKLARDLINTPAADMMPQDLAQAASILAERHHARITVISGEALLEQGYPAIHAVGRASAHAPCLIDMIWGEDSAPKVTLVGKGVCFDSGGLDLKPSSGMKLMKKDMGGAAILLGLADMIMSWGLKIRLRVLIPAVENAVSGNAFRPLDILSTRKGMTVEIGNTDAEGRLILADALFEAANESPDLILDMATLTGAARSALGPDLPALFSNDDALAQKILNHAKIQSDPLWRLPLWQDYASMLDSKSADINNCSDSPYAGAITAALFLEKFVGSTPWAHIDVMAWNTKSRPGRPEGGEAMAMRALFSALYEIYD